MIALECVRGILVVKHDLLAIAGFEEFKRDILRVDLLEIFRQLQIIGNTHLMPHILEQIWQHLSLQSDLCFGLAAIYDEVVLDFRLHGRLVEL